MSNAQQSQAALVATSALLAKSNERLNAAIHALQIIAARTPQDNIDAGYLAKTTLQTIQADADYIRRCEDQQASEDAESSFAEGLLEQEEECPDCGELVSSECDCEAF